MKILGKKLPPSKHYVGQIVRYRNLKETWTGKILRMEYCIAFDEWVMAVWVERLYSVEHFAEGEVGWEIA
jgi:hypothetical protein